VGKNESAQLYEFSFNLLERAACLFYQCPLKTGDDMIHQTETASFWISGLTS